MKTKFFIIALLFGSFYSLYLKGQPTVPSISNQNVREQVELITDRNLYLAGENIWFSAYITLNVNDSVRQLSNVLYVEVYNKEHAVIQKKFKINNGSVEGMIPIPNELISANYYLRAYTRYQRNFSPESYFTTSVTIINPESPVRKPDDETDELINILPENGKLVNGLPSKLAMKIDPGIVDEVENCYLKDQFNNNIDSVQFSGNGIALLEFIPHDSLNYTLSLSLKSGDTISKPLPEILKNGLIISSNPEDQSVDIYASRVYLENNATHYKLLIISNDLARHLIPIELDGSYKRVSINSAIEKEGIYFVGIQNEEGKVITYSSVFWKPDIVELKIKTDKNVFGTREKVQIDLDGNEDIEQKLKYLTVSVVKEGTDLTSGQNIPMAVFDNPKLIPAFSGRLELKDESIKKQVKAALILDRDALNYSLPQNDQMNKWLAETRDVSISGVVRNAKNKEPISGKWIFASVLGENPQFHAYRSREDGLFVFSLNHLRNDRDVSLSTDSIPGVNIEFLIYNDFSDKWSLAKDIPLMITKNQKELLKEMWRNQQVEKKFIPKRKIRETGIDTIPFPLTDVQQSIELDKYVALPTMTEVLDELVPYVNVRKRKGENQINITEESKQRIFEDPLMLVDYLPVYNVDEILSINPAKVVRIDVINRVYNYGDLLLEGVLIIRTNTDDFAGIRLPYSSVFVEYKTITPAADIEYPDYGAGNNTDRHDPDFKNVLFWNPSVNLTGDTKLSFYTADERADYEIIVRGQMKDGRMIYGKHKIRVRN